MKTILVVDDHADIRRLLTSALQSSFAVVEARDCHEALTAIQRHKPNAALLDIMLPGINGFAVLQAIRCDPACNDMPVAMLSALNQAGEIDRADKLGADAYFVKPFSPMQIKNWLDCALGDEQPLTEAGPQ